MKRHLLTPILIFVALILILGLACSIPFIQPTDPIEQPIDDPSQVQPDPVDQPVDDPNQVQADLPPTPAGMVPVPAGNFQMGCVPSEYFDCAPGHYSFDRELPQHTVYLDGFFIDIHEVTNSQYAQCVAAGVCADPKSHIGFTTGETVYDDAHYGDPQYANYPVTFITWTDADNYCTWVGKSLPTEAQWEKAARGSSDTRMWPWGNTYPTCALLNFWNHDTPNNEGMCGTNLNGCATAAVGSYPEGASPYGVMDIAGNVWEWTADWAIEDYYTYYEPDAWPANPFPSEEELDAVGGTELKVVRGGGWNSNYLDIRLTGRQFFDVTEYSSGNTIGFRCVSNP